MKNVVSVLVGVAVFLFALGTVTSFGSFEILRIEPSTWSSLSFTLTLMAGAYLACQSAGVFPEAAGAGTDREPSNTMKRLGQAAFVLVGLGFLFGVIALLSRGPFLGKISGAWLSGATNLSLILIVGFFGVYPRR